MLQLILGTSGTGKTTYILEKIKNYTKEEKKCILIVPEQFSKTAEGLISQSLADNGLNFASVYSFTSLIKNVKEDGKISLPSLLTKAGKAVLSSSALNSLRELKNYHKQRDDITFSYTLSELFDEFKRSGISAYDLFSISENKNEKLKEISLIYTEYQNLLDDKFSDNEEILSLFSKNIPLEYIEDSFIFIDNFESFSKGQLDIISSFFKNSKGVYISLPLDDLYENENSSEYFNFSRNTAQKLVKEAKNIGVSVKKPISLITPHRFLNSSINTLDSFLKNGITTGDTNNIYITEFENQYNETAFLAAKIQNLIKEGYSYNDIAVISPQIEKYENQLEEIFTLAKIPYFIDQNRIISSSSPVLAIKSILDLLANGMNEEVVMNFLKTNITLYNKDTINYLENYLFIWQDYTLNWSEDFSLPINGIENKNSEKDDEILKDINNLKKDIKQKLSIFNKEEELKAKEILSIVYNLFLDFGCEAAILNLVSTSKDEEAATLLKRQWEEVVLVLNELYEIIKDKIFSPQKILDLFSLMIEGAQIGFSPQTQDCVMISEPARIKTDEIKALFILGAAQDIFPRSIGEGAILNLKDKELITASGFDLKQSFDNLYDFNLLYFYKSLTTAKEKLFISIAKNNIGTSEIFSSEISHIKASLNISSASLIDEDYAITPEFFKDYILQNSNDFDKKSIVNLLSSLDISVLEKKEKDFNLKDLDYLNDYLGQTLNLSPTAVENYFKCPFMYFLNNLYRLKPIEKANFSQRHAGDYLHYVAYKILEKYKGDYHNANFNEVKLAAEDVINDYITTNYPEEIIKTSQFQSLSNNMRENVFQLLEFIYIEQQNSLFRPVGFEKEFRFNSDLKPLEIINNNKTATVSGVLDRIDLYKKDGVNFLRIIDYKTGTKDFSLDDIYNGLSSQLLIYMNALIDNKFENLDNLEAAALVYQPSDISFKFDKNDESLYTPIGMALKDLDVSEAFDTSLSGKFGVLKGSDKISSLKGSEVVSKEEMQAILNHSKENIKILMDNVFSGDFSAMPIEISKTQKPCDYCSYKTICQNKTAVKPKEKNNFKAKPRKDLI